MITRRVARPLGAFSAQSWTCPACARTSFLQQRIQPQTPPPQRRKQSSIRDIGNERSEESKLPFLSHHQRFQQEGVPGLFSPQGYEIGWTTYESMISSKLSQLIANEPLDAGDPRKLAIQFARDPMNASLFNHASMLHNNHFFFSSFSPRPMQIESQPQLRQSLEKTFGSMETLRTTMLDTADAMFGPGFVWLVWARDMAPGTMRRGDWRILTTYLAGTPYPEAGYRQQGLDMNTNNAASYAAYQSAQPVNQVGAFGSYSQKGREQAAIPPGGTHVMPVLCVNTWEHVYIYDYGLLGKRKYLSDWWAAVDWYAVEHKTPPEAKREGSLYWSGR